MLRFPRPLDPLYIPNETFVKHGGFVALVLGVIILYMLLTSQSRGKPLNFELKKTKTKFFAA